MSFYILPLVPILSVCRMTCCSLRQGQRRPRFKKKLMNEKYTIEPGYIKNLATNHCIHCLVS